MSSQSDPRTEIVATPFTVSGQQRYGDTVFPYALQIESATVSLDSLTNWIKSHRDDLLQLAGRHGAILFRGFPMRSAEDFDAFISSFDLPNFPYKKSLSNAVRVNRTERVFSANEAPPDVKILYHHEMAQTPIYPNFISFFCEIAADEGGATPICRSDVLFERLRERAPEFASACETKGLRYSNVMPAEEDAQSGMGRSWKGTLGVDSREAAERRLKELNYDWQWQPDGSLRATTPPLPAVKDVGGGRKSFFNQLIAAFCGWKDERNDPSEAIRHGDGSRLDQAGVAEAVALADELTFDLAWRPGDAVLIDNNLVMHARRPFRGTRKVLASLADMQQQSFAITE